MLRWTKVGKIENIKEIGCLVPDFQYKNRYVMYFGEKTIKLAYSSQLTAWKIVDQPLLEKRDGFFDDGALEVAKVYKYSDHILVLYYAKNNKGNIKVGAAGFDSCLLYTSPSPRDRTRSRMPSSA